MDKKSQEQALDRVTDHVEESAEVDQNVLAAAMKDLVEAETEAAKKVLERKKMLDAVAVNKEDVELIVKEFELASGEADLLLRENDGDVKKALVQLVKGA